MRTRERLSLHFNSLGFAINASSVATRGRGCDGRDGWAKVGIQRCKQELELFNLRLECLDAITQHIIRFIASK